MKLIWENKSLVENKKQQYRSVLKKFNWDTAAEKIFEILISTS
jgi:hypothetical protein